MKPEKWKWCYWIFLLQLISKGYCQFQNTPPYMHLDREWHIEESEPVGSKIVQVHGNDAEGGPLVYGLEAMQFFGSQKSPDKIPFRIDAKTGAVYLNESLKGRAGQDLHLYVTLSDGDLVAKTEVYVQIHNSLKPYKNKSVRPPGFPGGSGLSLPSGFLNYHEYNKMPPQIPPISKNVSNVLINPPLAISNNPPPRPSRRPNFTVKPSIEKEYKNTQKVTQLKPISIKDNDITNNLDTDVNTDSHKRTQNTPNEIDKDDESNEFDIKAYTVKSQKLTETIVPIISVCAVFLTVGMLAVVFRKKIYLGKSKDAKDDIKKDSSVLQDEPSISMQEWRGPRAFSNRYEPWQRDEISHMEVSNQSSVSRSIEDNDRWEFPRHRLKFFNILGEGAFGQVWKCEAMDLDGNNAGPTTVAVKTLKENANEKEKSDLLSELQVMKMLESHPNVVKLLACCTEKEPIFLIMEYISKGKLQSYLRNSRAERYYNNMHGKSNSLTSRDLTSFCYQVARGMEFLSANGIIHRDLAARNILITEDHTCKVADFGFARDVIASHIYERKSEGRLPIRWMAPESLYDNIFTVKSDIWSFGVLIWEVVTLGSTPYPGIPAADVMRKVKDGYRLDKPEHCRREIYNIMYYCWDKDPKARPSFTECVELLEKLLLTETEYIELERFPDHSYYNMMSLSGEKL